MESSLPFDITISACAGGLECSLVIGENVTNIITFLPAPPHSKKPKVSEGAHRFNSVAAATDDYQRVRVKRTIRIIIIIRR